MALADMGGMLFMWMANRRISARTADANRHAEPKLCEIDAEQLVSSLALSSQEERDDTEPAEREKNPNAVVQPAVVPESASTSTSRMTPAIGPHQQRIYLFTLSLLIQLLINGINNGHRATEIDHTSKLIGNVTPGSSLDYISRYVYSLFENGMGHCFPPSYALLTSSTQALMTLALSTTLRAASFPTARCKHHLIAAAAAMPLAEMFSYTVIKVIGISPAQYEVFPLIALRSFTASPVP